MADSYTDKFDPAKKYFKVLNPDQERHLHSHDLNEAQTILGHRIKGVGDALMADGNVVRGCAIRVDQTAGTVSLEAGAVYVDGIVHEVAAATLTVPMDQVITIGICVTETIVTHVEDAALKGEIPGTRAFGEPGAARQKIEAVWSWSGATCGGKYYAIYEVNNGVVVDQTPPPSFDPINSALARYDREANGHYVVSGWQVKALGLQGTNQVFSIAEGTANVWGNKITRETAQRLEVLEDPDIQHTPSEPHTIPNDASGSVQVTLNHGPITEVVSVTVTRETTATITHGSSTGVSDPLPDTGVSSIVTITQGATTFVEGTDYVLNADQVDWSPGGNEPAPGSSYDVTYRHLVTGPPDASDSTSVTVSNVVPGSQLIANYKWALPRIDTIAVDRAGGLHYIKGQATLYNPWPPAIPLDMLRLADIENRWGNTPIVKDAQIRSVHYNKLQLYGDLIYDLFDLVAQERLRRDMDSRQPTTKRGVFVDPFLDDDMRDQGIAQTGAIVAQTLRLPITPTITRNSLGDAPLLLPYTEEAIIEQPLATGCMKINPYQAFEPLPARATLDPAVDVWTEVNESWTSAITRRITSWFAGSDVSIETVSETESEAETLRQIPINFTLEGFGAGENLIKVTFDGVDVTP